MKKNITNIILVILVIVIGILVGYTLYDFTNTDNEVNNDEVDDNNTLDSETITITDEELIIYAYSVEFYIDAYGDLVTGDLTIMVMILHMKMVKVASMVLIVRKY